MVVANANVRSDPAHASADRAALGALINIAGRQRMLSHRAVMFLALSRLPGGEARHHLEQAAGALTGFGAGVRLLLDGDLAEGVPPLFSERVGALLAGQVPGHGSGVQALRAFGDRGHACLQRLQGADVDCDGEIRALAELAGSVLLPLLNKIVAAFEQDLAEALQSEAARVEAIRGVMSDALDDIEVTATRIRLIAFNALIEAARAGDAGRAFSVIAEEIKNLGTQTRAESAKMQAAIARLFAV